MSGPERKTQSFSHSSCCMTGKGGSHRKTISWKVRLAMRRWERVSQNKMSYNVCFMLGNYCLTIVLLSLWWLWWLLFLSMSKHIKVCGFRAITFTLTYLFCTSRFSRRTTATSCPSNLFYIRDTFWQVLLIQRCIRQPAPGRLLFKGPICVCAMVLHNTAQNML